MDSAWAAVMYWGYGWSQMLFVTHQLWGVNCDFCYCHTLPLLCSAIPLCSLNPTTSCWTTCMHFPSRWEARACPTHGKLGCLTVAHAHLFSLPCRMEWWCLVLHTVTRRNTWPLCCTSQYEHYSYLWPIVLGQCSLRKKMLHLTKCTSALCCSKWTLISYCSWDFQVLLYFPYFVSPTLEVLGNGSFTATRQVAKVSVPLVSSVKKPPI